jgi:hypothetical protein
MNTTTLQVSHLQQYIMEVLQVKSDNNKQWTALTHSSVVSLQWTKCCLHFA